MIALELSETVVEQVAERVAEIVVARMPATTGGTVWLTVEQVADYLQTSGDSVRAQVKRQKIPHHRAGGRLLFDRDEIDSWVRSG